MWMSHILFPQNLRNVLLSFFSAEVIKDQGRAARWLGGLHNPKLNHHLIKSIHLQLTGRGFVQHSLTSDPNCDWTRAGWGNSRTLVCIFVCLAGNTSKPKCDWQQLTKEMQQMRWGVWLMSASSWALICVLPITPVILKSFGLQNQKTQKDGLLLKKKMNETNPVTSDRKTKQ